jgi:hypothetical protein
MARLRLDAAERTPRDDGIVSLAALVDRLCEEARVRLHHAIDVRAGMELARPLKSYPRRLGQLYKRKQ